MKHFASPLYIIRFILRLSHFHDCHLFSLIQHIFGTFVQEKEGVKANGDAGEPKKQKTEEKEKVSLFKDKQEHSWNLQTQANKGWALVCV